MPAMPTIRLVRPITAVSVIGTPQVSARRSPATHNPREDGENERLEMESSRRAEELQRLCTTVRTISDKLNKVCEETISRNQKDIARLAVEIARKVLAWKTAAGDYDIQTVIEEALKRAPTRQQVVVHMNPEDLRTCQQLQQEATDGPLGGIELVVDASIAPGDCLVETPKGIVKSFVEEHLERIGEALMQVE